MTMRPRGGPPHAWNADLAAALNGALASDAPVEVIVSPENAPHRALETLLAVRSRVRISPYWSSRNAGYLFAVQRV